MVKKNKEKTVSDVEKDKLKPGSEGAENSGDKETVKKKKDKGQPEFKDMPDKVALVDGKPAKTPMEKQAVKMLEVFEDLKAVSDALASERNKLLGLMKDDGREVLNLKDKEGKNFEVKITTGDEKISIKSKKEEML